MIGRFEENKVYLEDCYKAIKDIPDKSVDLIMTDPPYELDTEGSKENNISKTFANCNKQIAEIKEGIDLAILNEFLRIMKKPNIYIWCNKKQILEYLKFFIEKHNCCFEILTWEKSNPTPLCGGNYLIDKEFCLYFRKGVKLNTKFETAFTYYKSKKNRQDKDLFEHPTIKPLDWTKTLIKNSTQKNDIVFDPFMGSGTTAVACKDIGRRYIGFDIKEKWFNIAQNRLNCENASGQQSLFLM